MPGLSDNIEVRSVVGRFLEHPRVFYFYNDRQEDLYIASADWMGQLLPPHRNLRADPRHQAQAPGDQRSLRPYLFDNVNAWEMQGDGSYKRKTQRGKAAQLGNFAGRTQQPSTVR